MTADDFGPDPIDDALRQRLGGASAPAGDPDATLAALTPRFQRARRRHRMVVAGSAALAVAAIVAVGSVVATTGGSNESNVRIPPANTGQPGLPVTTTTAPPTPPSPSGPEPATTRPPTTGTTAPGTGAPTTSGDAGASPSTPSPVTKTYQSEGGTLTVKVDSGALSIVATSPASGYSEVRHDIGPSRVEVRFTNDKSGTEWRIRVDLSNGQPVEEITKHGS